MKDSFFIGDIGIGAGNKPIVIPEIGINHNGDIQVAKEMVDAAAEAGARLVKHQTHIVEDEMSHIAERIIPGNADISIMQIMRECALNEEEEKELKEYAEAKGLVFLSTPFSRAAADRLEKLGVCAYKIGSGELNNYPLLDYVASFGKPMIVSTGMNNLNAVAKAVDILEMRNVDYALLHTTNLYPTEPRLVRLGAMKELQESFPGVPIGLSDHTLNNNACKAAIALGASIVERHFTDFKWRTGPDLVCSMDKEELRDLLAAAVEIPQMLGGTKVAAEEEDVTIKFAFASVVSIKEIRKGDIFSTENLWVKRPGTGELLAEEYNKILGRKASVDIPSDAQISRAMIEEL